MLLCPIQKTANFQTQREQCTERLLNSRTPWVRLMVGLVSLYVVWVWQCL